MAKVYIGIGSNLGNREENIAQALKTMPYHAIRVLKESSIIETDPVGGPPQDKYLNSVIEAETALSPEELLGVLQYIEKQLGRVRTVVNGPRTIDLDILFYDNLTINLPHLSIPHPRMFQREFVLKPLKQIAPNAIKNHSHANH